MQTAIAQTLSLVMHGNAFLKALPLGNYWPDSPYFRFCHAVRFVARREGAERTAKTIIAADPQAWLEGLRGRCTGLRVHIAPAEHSTLPDHVAVAFAGGGSRWLLEAVGQGGSSIWESDWSGTHPDAADQRVWTVEYIRLADAWPSRAPTLLLSAACAEFADALTAIADFSRRADTGFTPAFDGGLAALSAPVGEGDDQAGLAPAGALPPLAGRLLAAGEAAWVFGGMGSWNDGAYGGDFTKEGDRLSMRLHAAIQQGFAAAANATYANARV